MPSIKDSIVIVEVDTGDDISDAEYMVVVFQHRDSGEISVIEGEFKTDGRDGIIMAGFVDGDAENVGATFTAQAYIRTAGGQEFYGTKDTFTLYNIIQEQ